MGSVVEPGPLVKKVIMKSSSDRVNASSAPDRTPGKMSGSVMRQKVTNSFAPKSIAASSTALSKPCNRARTTSATKGMLKAMCETMTVPSPSESRRSPCNARVAFAQLNKSEEHTSELQSPLNLVCRLLLEKKKNIPMVKHTLWESLSRSCSSQSARKS